MWVPALVAGPRTFGHQRKRDVEVRGFDDPEAGSPLLGLDERAVGGDGLVAASVDHGRGGRVGKPGREDPVAARDQLLGEDVDRGLLLGGSRFAAVVDDVDQVLDGLILSLRRTRGDPRRGR
jgi:hypothetical protein